MNIGFIGGCINKPNGLEEHKIYHSLLNDVLSELDIEIKTDKYLCYSGLKKASLDFVKRESLDILFVFIRHFPYMVLNKPLIKVIGEKGTRIYRLHPRVIKRKLKYWPIELDKYIFESNNIQIPKRNFFGLRDINSFIGIFFGLHNWAYNYVESIINELKEFCFSENVKLVIIGPTKNPESIMGDKICTNLNMRLVKSSQLNNIDFIDINNYEDKNRNNLFQTDRIHFNEVGHFYLFNKILDKINTMQLTPLHKPYLVNFTEDHNAHCEIKFPN